ncbi:MAG: glycoside hydrolase family 2 TIM barrel-domain containing protein [Kiritimatiellae bacterium]|nr:glycoside hydrolase family 2 TIM barrel-domain containing protein [Kiritimatiellia bacterium]
MKNSLVCFLLAAASCCLAASSKPCVCTNALETSWGRAVTPTNAWSEYPRPQLVRSTWTSLNGEWDYAVTSVMTDEPKAWDGKILVPFPIESPLSGVRRAVTPDDQIWYRRTFVVQPRPGTRTILNFERVDFRASVFVNGVEAMDVPHEGGNTPFSVDVTDLVKAGENELKVLVWDPTDTHLGGTGKQVLKLWTCFFGAASGICGGVWLETVPETYLADYQVKTDAARRTVTVVPEVKGRLRTAEVAVTVSFEGRPLATARVPAGESATLELPAPLRLWSCEEPNLYDLAIDVGADHVTGYFGIRTLGTKLDARGVRRVVVNGRFTYLLATLDQGWWPDGLLTPPSEDACRFDVDFHKKAGFNAIRKHIKIEPRAFYAHCDRIGVMVLQDIPSFGPDNRQHELSYANKRYAFYRQELKDCVDLLCNHPSVVMWIPYNEGWGQPSADKTRFTNKWLRRYDPSRLIDGPSGWNDYEGGRVLNYAHDAYADVADPEIYTDCVDLHHYPDARMHPVNPHRVSFLGEFGGMGVSLEGHVCDPKGDARRLVPVEPRTWQKSQHDRYAFLMEKVVELAGKGLGGSVYTEAIDQFWELGGFVTFDRAVVKLDYDFLREVHRRVYDAARVAAETPLPKKAGLAVEWEWSPALDRGEWPRLQTLTDGRLAFTYSRRLDEAPGSDLVLRWSSDKGRNWSPAQRVIPSFTCPNGLGAVVGYSILNPELVQMPTNHPAHPGRLIASANLRPIKATPRSPSSIGFAVSDDAGRTWGPLRALLPLAGDPGVTGGRGCWEPFVTVRPDGTLDLYYTDISAPPGGQICRNISRFVSRDGGDTWQGPEVILAGHERGIGVGIPSATTFGDALYLAHEAHPKDHPAWPTRPYVAQTRADQPFAAPPRVVDPFLESIPGDVYCGAPYLVQTEHYFLLSAQVGRPQPKKDPTSLTQMRVWVMPKTKVGAMGDLNAFASVENPLGDTSPLHWNGLAPLGGDEVMATCQHGGDLHLVRGRIVEKGTVR